MLDAPFKVDLHCHSHFSDGTLSPQALIERANAASIQLLALTDHDTTTGSAALREAAKGQSIQVIDGIELSVRWKCHDIHILGLNIDINEATFIKLIAQQNEARIKRAIHIAERLAPTGISHLFQKASDLAGHERIARPHFAQVLVNEGLVSDLQSAFKRYLARGRLAYVPTDWLSIDEAVGGIVQAGGRACIAHPLTYPLTASKRQALILSFKAAGGVGMEVVSGEMSLPQINEMAGLCDRFSLLASSGSDYHDDQRSRVKLGQQRSLPASCQPIWTGWIA